MTDLELNAAVAEKVLGLKWKVIDGRFCVADEQSLKKDWRETNHLTWTGVGLIVEAMRERGFSFMLYLNRGVSGDFTVEFFTERSRNDGVAHEDFAPCATALAALAALKTREGK